MRKFSNIRTYSEVHELCVAQGVPFDDEDYLLGGNTVRVGQQDSGFVIYDTTTGLFSGTTPEGIEFDSLSTEYDGQEWFAALLAFFYVD